MRAAEQALLQEGVSAGMTGMAERWEGFLESLRDLAAAPLPLPTQGRLVRVAGLVLEAAGIRVPVGSLCEVQMAGQPAVQGRWWGSPAIEPF